MKRVALLFLAVLALVPLAYCQTDVDGNKMANQVRLTFDSSNYSDGRSSGVSTLDVTHRFNDTFSIEGLANGGQYFDAKFGGGGLYLTVNPNSSSYITFGGLRNTATNTTQSFAASIEGGTLLYKNSTGFIRAVEGDYNQTWKGYKITPETNVTMYTPRVILYFPKGFDLMLHAGAVDLIKAGVHDTTPSGGARLRIPVTRRFEFTASAGFDSEGMTNIQQLATLSTRNIGGGLKVWLNRTTSIEALGTESYYTVNHLSGTTIGVSLIKRFN